MLEIIKSQYDSGTALFTGKNYHLTKRELWPAFANDLFPVTEDYYFELNPYFTFKVHHNDLYSVAKTFFVRDGLATFAAFILKNHRLIPSLNTHFIIHPSLTPLIPKNCQQFFSCWQMVQPKKMSLDKVKRVLIFGILSEQYLLSLENVTTKLEPLQVINPDIEIDIYLPLRKEMFEIESKETVFYYQVIEKIKDVLGERKINFILTKDLMEKTFHTDCYLIDLAYNNFIVSDNYINYHLASRGGTIASFSSTPPTDSQFKLALSLNHEVHISPFPEKTESIFSELFFSMKTSAIPPLNNPKVHELIRNL